MIFFCPNKVRESSKAHPSPFAQKSKSFCSKQSHVKRSVQFLRQLQDLHLETTLHVHQHLLIRHAVLTLLLVRLYEVNRQSLSPESSRSTHSVQVTVSVSRKI